MLVTAPIVPKSPAEKAFAKVREERKDWVYKLKASDFNKPIKKVA